MNEPAVDTIPQMIARGTARGGALTILHRDPSKTESRGYPDLHEEAGKVAGALSERGFRPGDRIGLLGETSLAFVTAAIAIWRAGATVVLLPDKTHVARSEWAASIAARTKATGTRAVLVPSGSLPADLGAPQIGLDELASADPFTAEIDPDGVATIFFSSGTTADPKAIPMTHRNTHHQIRFRRHVTAGSGPGFHLFWWSPLHTTMSFQRAVLDPLTQGVSVTYMHPRNLIADPRTWLLEISRRRITHSAGPTYGFELASRALEEGFEEPLDLSNWIECGAAGELVNPAIMERFFELTRPFGLDRSSFVCTYATTETSIITTGRSPGGLKVDHVDPDSLAEGLARPSSSSNRSSFVSTGPPIDGVELRIVNERGEDLEERCVGDILVRSPATMTNYLGLPGRLDWFPTRDRGYMADGELFLVGRLEDLVIVRGANISTSAIEAAAASVLPTGFVACAFGVPRGPSNEIVVVIGHPEGVDVDGSSEAVRRELWKRMGLSVHDLVLVPETELPRSSGKLERAALRRGYLEDVAASDR